MALWVTNVLQAQDPNHLLPSTLHDLYRLPSVVPRLLLNKSLRAAWKQRLLTACLVLFYILTQFQNKKGSGLLHKFQACFSQNCLSCFNMAGVIGSLDLGWVASCFACLSLIPFSVHSSSGHAATNGSPMPDTTYIFLIADRYPLIDECFKPSSARWATYRHNWSSLNGSGVVFVFLQKDRYRFWPDV